jgi:hypothetical protein
MDTNSLDHMDPPLIYDTSANNSNFFTQVDEDNISVIAPTTTNDQSVSYDVMDDDENVTNNDTPYINNENSTDTVAINKNEINESLEDMCPGSNT